MQSSIFFYFIYYWEKSVMKVTLFFIHNVNKVFKRFKMQIFQWANKHLIPRKFEKIRIGNNKDGGYVLPKKCVDESDLFISFGLGFNVTYETDLLNRNKKVIGYDIVKEHEWARQMKLDAYEEFSNILEVQQSNKIVLKIDTEGSEWNFFQTMDMKHFAEKISCFAFELHLHVNHKNTPLLVMEKMFDTHYVAHVHGNNYSSCKELVPIALEITLANKKYFNNPPIDNRKYPLKDLDYANNYENTDLDLPWLYGARLL